MKRILSIFIFSILWSGAFAQSVNMDLLKSMKPRAIGPAGMSGRVTAIDVVTDQPDIIYAGTASGGLWKSTSGGIDWEPVFDNEEVSSVGALAIQQSNPDILWVGTGEGNPRNSVTGGYGLYKSLDGGKSWKLVGLEKTRNIHRIVIDPNNPNTVYVGAIGSSWGEHPERGVYKTTDGGKSWNKILYTNEKSGCADLIMDPSNPNKLFAAMWEHRRKPWTFNSGGPGSGLYMTVDGGENWKKLSDEDGLPKGELGRIGLAIAKNKPEIVYALVESKKNALYKSTDGGYKWKKINDGDDIGNRPFYYSDIFVDPTNENRVYSLFSLVNVSEDGGKSFRTLLPYSGIHPDHHAWWIHPNNGDFMIDGNDGGMNITRDGGKTWRFVENLPVAQFYHINVDMEFPYNVYGGMQDNGSWVGPAYVLRSQGIRNSYWQEVMFGDGFDVLPDPDNSRYGYAMSQQGNVARYDRETGKSAVVRPTPPEKDVELRFNWNAPIAQDPFDNSTIYYASQFVHKSTDKGKTWEVISGDLTTNDPEKQKQDESGGLTIDATGAENFCTVISLAPSPVSKGIIWAGSDDGRLHITRNGGESWVDVTGNISGMPSGAWIPQIRASSFNPGEALVVVNNYRQFDFKPYLFRTRDYGKTWEKIVDENSVWGYVLSVVQDPKEKNLMFLGSEYGLYISIDEGKNWTKWTNDYPTVSTIDLAIHPRENDLVIGTFGRAAYVLDDIKPLREMASSAGNVINEKIHVYEPPVAILAEYQQPEGSRFPGDAFFQGENRRRGAMISYSINRITQKTEVQEEKKGRRKKGKSDPEPAKEEEKKDMKKASADSVFVMIYNSEGDKIRDLKFKAPEENGLHRMYWYTDENGTDRPTRRTRRRGGWQPGGAEVLPGTYTVWVKFDGDSSKANIEVKTDPRLDVDISVLQAKYNRTKEIEKDIEVLADITKRLSESLEAVSEYQKMMKDKKGDEWKEAKEMAKSAKDTLNQFMDRILGSESDKQGITRSNDPTVAGYFYTAAYYTRSTYGAPGATEEKLYNWGKKSLAELIEDVNAYYGDQWPKLKEEMERLDLSPFKNYEPIEIKN